MDWTLQYLILGVIIFLWLLFCLRVYQVAKYAAWLAGSTVSTCLFFLGATVATSFLVSGATVLIPLWICILILSFVHLSAARKNETNVSNQFANTQATASSDTSKHRDMYI